MGSFISRPSSKLIKVAIDIGGVLIPERKPDPSRKFDISKFMPGAIIALERMCAVGCENYIVSYSPESRIAKTVPDLKGVPEFTKLIDPANWIFVTNEATRAQDKARVCSQIGADVFIDDLLDICESVKAAGIPNVFWFTAEPKEASEGIINVTNWAELCERILEVCK